MHWASVWEQHLTVPPAMDAGKAQAGLSAVGWGLIPLESLNILFLSIKLNIY